MGRLFWGEFKRKKKYYPKWYILRGQRKIRSDQTLNKLEHFRKKKQWSPQLLSKISTHIFLQEETMHIRTNILFWGFKYFVKTPKLLQKILNIDNMITTNYKKSYNIELMYLLKIKILDQTSNVLSRKRMGV